MQVCLGYSVTKLTHLLRHFREPRLLTYEHFYYHLRRPSVHCSDIGSSIYNTNTSLFRGKKDYIECIEQFNEVRYDDIYIKESFRTQGSFVVKINIMTRNKNFDT